MALRSRSLFLYGVQVTDSNKYINFKISGGGPELVAILQIGYYSLSTLLTEIKDQLEAIDTANVYTVTADRTYNGNLENRVTIATNGAFLSLLFGSGTQAASSAAALIGFAATDRTGATTYTGVSSAGTVLVPTEIGYSYTSQERNQKVFGAVNISTSGLKETIVFQIQRFIKANYKYEPTGMVTPWSNFLVWAIKQRPFDFTPEISDPTVFYPVTLDRTIQDGQGLMFELMEMLSENHPFLYETGLLTMRILEV